MSFSIKDKQKGLIGTIIFHGILVMLIVLLGFSTPLPLPSEQGILINFGEDDFGAGYQEPVRRIEKPVSTPVSPPIQESNASLVEEESILTQETEEAPFVETKKKPEIKKEDIAKEEEVQKEKTEEKPKEERKPIQKALFPSKNQPSNDANAEGISNGSGNQGVPTGSAESKSHFIGQGQGGGTSFSLEGRYPLNLQQPEYRQQLEGIVVVEIKVDKNGMVRSARPGVKGSTTMDSELLEAAKRAALQSRFDRNPEASEVQVGTITYHFKLK